MGFEHTQPHRVLNDADEVESMWTLTKLFTFSTMHGITTYIKATDKTAEMMQENEKIIGNNLCTKSYPKLSVKHVVGNTCK